MNAQAATNVAELVRLLEHQRTLYRRLRLLGDRQRALVTMDDAQGLLELLSERQQLVDGLVGLTARMAPFRTGWTQLYQEMDEFSKKRITSLLEEVNGSLGSILSSDSCDTATLKARRETTAHQLSGLGAGIRAGAAYTSAGATVSPNVLAEAHA